MSIALKVLGPNQTEVTLDDVELLFSYSTLVAAYSPKLGWLRTSKKWSKTTSRHINAWLDGVVAREMSQETLEQLISTRSY